MSISKPYFAFPYYDYPYTFKEKIGYAIGKIYCGCMHLIGVSIYAKFFLWGEPYLSEKQIIDKKIEELIEFEKISNKKRSWHCKSFIIGAFSFMVPIIGFVFLKYVGPHFKTMSIMEQLFSKNANCFVKWSPFAGISVYKLYKFQPLSQKYLNYISLISGIFLVNNIYGILTHTYNKIRYRRQINVLNHGIKIIRAIRAMKSEIKSLANDNQNNFNQQSIESSIYSEIFKKKCEWTCYSLADPDENISYVIRNGYYEKLFFVFYSEITANDFLIELNKLNSNEIDFFDSNRSEANKYQNEFIASRIHSGLMYCYYFNEK